jgi:hypothetical protein
MAVGRTPSARGASRARVIGHFPASTMWSVEKRLASAERELRVQFTRIAQLQAELDLLVGALRRLPDAVQRDQLGAAVMRTSNRSRHDAEERIQGDRLRLE